MADQQAVSMNEPIEKDFTSLILNGLREKTSYQYAALVGITLIAASIRLYRLGEWSFWRDELATITRALGHFNIESIIEQWWRPPLSILLTGGVFNLFEVNEWTARIPSVFIGVITIPIIYFIGRRLFNEWVALTATVLFTFSTWHIYWSQNARFYTSLMLFYFLASVAFYLYIERGSLKYLLLFGVFLFIAMGERLIALLIVPVIVFYLFSIWILRYDKPKGFNLNRLGYLFIPGGFFALLEVYSLITTSNTRIGQTVSTFVGRPIDDPFRILILIFFNIGIPLVIMALLGGILLILQKNRLGLFLFVSAFVPPFILIIGSSFTFTVDRYAFVSLPAWIFLASFGVVAIAKMITTRPFLIYAGLIGLLCADMMGSNLMYFQINHGNRQDWRQAMAWVSNQAEAEDVIVASVSDLGSYYAGRDVTWLGDLKINELTNDGTRYWFVIDSENGWFSPVQKKWVEDNATLLDVLYLRVRENINIKIFKYSGGSNPP
jgi:mannosyltransferase